MLKLLKNMRRQERLMALACLLLVAGQVYFDLKLPDYMTELTKLIKTAGSTTADITSVGLRMLGCFYWRKPLLVWRKPFVRMDFISIWMTCMASTPREKAS